MISSCPRDGDLEVFFGHKINNFPPRQISIVSPGLVSNQICFSYLIQEEWTNASTKAIC